MAMTIKERIQASSPSSSKMPHGIGRMEYSLFRSYAGEWNHGKWHGHGTVKCQVYQYTGMFQKDQKDGVGKLTQFNIW